MVFANALYYYLLDHITVCVYYIQRRHIPTSFFWRYWGVYPNPLGLVVCILRLITTVLRDSTDKPVVCLRTCVASKDY